MKEFDEDFFQNRFLPRVGMYIQPITKETMIAFVHGYEQGRNLECSFSKELSKLLENEYQLVKGAMGWPEQIQRWADKKGISWIEAFLQLSDELIKSDT